MNDSPTRMLNQLLALGANPDDIEYTVEDGEPFIELGRVTIALGPSSQAAIDKLATVAAQAAADQRARNLLKAA